MKQQADSWLSSQDQPATAYLSFGSNLGDRTMLMTEALRGLSRHADIQVEQVSSLYETDPVGITEQPAFLNAVVKIRTTLSPLELLHVCHSVEQDLGRRRILRWGPRTMDIDLLTYNQLKLETPDLVLPHPRMQARDFVLVPLREIDAGECSPTEAVRLFLRNWFRPD